MKEKLPKSTASLILGIFSIITCFCYGLPGLILGIIGFIQGKQAIAINNENPDMYEGVGNAKAGKVMSIIGIVFAVIYLIAIIWIVSYFGIETLKNPELLQEKLQELQGM